MASLPAPPAPGLAPARSAAVIAAGCGIAAALVILGLMRDLAIASAFLASALVLASGLLIFRRLFAPGRADVAEPDWSVARTLAATTPEAVAITDRAGRLVCANDRFEALFGGFPTPPGLPVDVAGVERLGAARRAGRRDGSASGDRVVARGKPLTARIQRPGVHDDLLVLRVPG